jgi:hypothetical protein
VVFDWCPEGIPPEGQQAGRAASLLHSIMNNSDPDISLGDDVRALGKKLH